MIISRKPKKPVKSCLPILKFIIYIENRCYSQYVQFLTDIIDFSFYSFQVRNRHMGPHLSKFIQINIQENKSL